MGNFLEKKYDIGLVVVFNRNIGNNLTNFALYKTLEELGYNVLVVDSTYVEGDPYFLFLRHWLSEISYCRNIECRDLNSQCDMFVLGSDQLWSKPFVEGSMYYTCLDWVDNIKYKMAYGTSFGIDRYAGNRVDILEFSLKRFNSIGVREASGADYLREFFGINARGVLDPVFLCGINEYKDMAKIGKLRNPVGSYIAAYCLDMTQGLSEAIRYVAKRKTNNAYHVIIDAENHFDGRNDYGINCLKEPTIEEWIASIYGCEFFITDSFHGMCFAIMFHKPFVVIFDKTNWRGYSRIIDFLTHFNIKERLINSYDKDRIDELINMNIDYERINSQLVTEILECKMWLRNEIEKGKCYKGKADCLDIARMVAKKEIKTQLENVLLPQERKTRSQLFVSKLEYRVIEKIEIYNDWKTKNMTVIGWGAGACFLRNLRIIKEVYDLQYVCDKDPNKWGQIYEGVQCISPKTLMEMGNKNIAVIIMIDNPGVTLQIVAELGEMGITHIDHVVNWLDALQGR